jgi:nuclear pore complex protein Nup133
VLNDAVHAYMEEIGDVHHHDVMRAFFRSRVADVGKLIKKVVRVARRAPESTVDLDKLLPETNRIILVRPGIFWH